MEKRYFVSYSIMTNKQTGFGDIVVSLQEFNLGKIKENIAHFLEEKRPGLCDPNIVILFFKELE